MAKIFKYQDGKLLQGEREPLSTRLAGQCPICGMNVYVSSGQALRYLNEEPTHKKCRKNV